MNRPRVIMLGLDGFDQQFAERLMTQGRLPALRQMRERGASLLLDHGSAKRTGLAWEHVSTGLSPERAQRWAAIDFDARSYQVAQQPTRHPPFAAALGCRMVVFDPPYFDLQAAPSVQGLVAWGAHDPGVERSARPAGLAAEIRERFGDYPAQPWIYGFVWPDEAKARTMAMDIVQAVEQRRRITTWLLSERLPDWDLAYVVISEYHSANESLWHGVDPGHPLASLPSATPARVGLLGVYDAADRMLGELMERFPDADIVAFNLHGMGTNDSDVASMALLPELMYRHHFGHSRLNTGPWPTLPNGVPVITGERRWGEEVIAALGKRALHGRARSRLRGYLHGRTDAALPPAALSLEWMPATRYRHDWPLMRAFALPAYYDGRVRINLRGRESAGRVPLAAYGAVCDEVSQLLRESRNVLTGEPVVKDIVPADRPAMPLGPSDADLIVLWNGSPLGFEHPRLGRIGPLPYHRTGGHSGPAGAAYFRGPHIRAGRFAERSAFDVLPTVLRMLDEPSAAQVSGRVIEPLLAPSDAALPA